MATQLRPDQLDIDEQLIRIRNMVADLDKRQVEINKLTQDVKLAGPQVIIQAVLAVAAVAGATAAIIKLFLQ